MTREKVIKALKWFKAYNEEDYCGGDRIQDEHGDWYYRITEQDFEAFDVAIKALEQEPCDDMVEIDLYSVIKQKYIEREVLDKIRAEIQQIIGERNLDDYDFCSGLIVARKIIDKYKAESKET